MRWAIYSESLWTPEVAQLADARVPDHLKGTDRITFHRERVRAQDLLKTLFPED